MDFFGAQDSARRKTWQLAALFTVAVVSLVVLTNLLIALVYAWTARFSRPGPMDPPSLLAAVPAEYWFWISAGVVGVVALASGYKYLQVRSGGRAIAEALGGRRIRQSTADARERRLLNVVEEMAIASGTPVPPVYLIEEPSINAFAAGYGPDDAVIGVNRGTLEHLSRDELQGVVGHEFSHILNGDSRLNLRLLAVLHGILFIGLVGHGLLRGVGRRPRRRAGSGGAPVLALGLGLLIIGYAGTFFGNVIKAAVSRQREFLADAAAVQFTRNPAGIAGALKKIGGSVAGSRMPGAAAAEVSHMFFGQATPVLLNGLLATHPPLKERIRAVDPRWDGRFPVVAAAPAAMAADGAASPGATAFATPTASGPDPALGVASGGADAAAGPATDADDVVAAVGRLDQQGLDHATRTIGGLPEPLREAAHDPFAGRALVYALVIHHEEAVRRLQLTHLDAHAEAGLPRELARLLPLVEPLDPHQKLTLLEMVVPALKELSDAQYRSFVGNLVATIKADRRIDLMEWVLHRLLVKELKPHFEGPWRLPVRHARIAAVAGEAVVLLSALARVGHATETARQAAFAAGLAALGIDGTLESQDDPNFARLNRALAELRTLKPLAKPKLIKACAATVLADGRIGPREGALLQGVAATLDCPLPPSIYGEARDLPAAAQA